jgi:predicted ribosome quality control (RQC) complex YloA/Tae2 family protein
VSNAVQFDPLLVRYLADELNQRLRGRGCTAAPFFAADRSVTLPLDRGEQLRIDLHPTRGYVRILPAAPDDDLELDAVLEEISSPLDERILHLPLRESSRFRSQTRLFTIELQTNQWNAVVSGEDGRIISVLNARSSGSRSLQPGAHYTPPPGEPRFGAAPVARDDARRFWDEKLSDAAPDDRIRRLLASFAFTGSLTARWILGIVDDTGFDADSAFERWWWIRGIPSPAPVLLEVGHRTQPFPVELSGVPGKSFPSLLAAMESLAGLVVTEEPARDFAVAEAAAFIGPRLLSATRKLESLRRELADSAGAVAIRAKGDLLLARLHQVRRGEAVARVEGWDGKVLEIALDPQLTPAENAARLYDEARRKERAEAQLPALVAAAEREVRRWRGAITSLESGEMPGWIAAMLREPSAAERKGEITKPGTAPPYRLFRTSGGLEVRVGRGAKENDRLTFRESAPEDVWLHARSVPGSHVILRWPQADAAPPARDLAEAAQLAAVFSRARTSATVAVDWTRRKHVRKPRGAAPGLVIPQRVKTLFVEPDEGVVDRLAVR